MSAREKAVEIARKDFEDEPVSRLHVDTDSGEQFKRLGVSPKSKDPCSPKNRPYSVRENVAHGPPSPVMIGKAPPRAKVIKKIGSEEVGEDAANKKTLKCPRCGKDQFENARDLGKHAIECKRESDAKMKEQNANKNEAVDESLLGNDRMAKLMRIKRMQNKHDNEVKAKEEQERIDKELELLIKMEMAREKRDEQLRKKKEAEEKKALEELRIQELKEKEERDRKQKERAALEAKLKERADRKAESSSESDSDESDDEDTIKRREQLKAQLIEKGQLPSSTDVVASSKAKSSKKAIAHPKTEPSPEPEGQSKPEHTTSETEESLGSDIDVDPLSSPYEGYTAAHVACYSDDVEHLKKIIELGGDLVSADPDGRSPLHICCYYGHDNCLEELVNVFGAMEGEEITWPTRYLDLYGKTPVHTAAEVGNFNAIALLGSLDVVSFDIPDVNGDMPLHTAVYYQYYDCVNMILQLGVSPDGPRNPITYKTAAANCAMVNIMELLVEYGADYYGIDANGRSILFDACARNLVDIAQYIISIDEERVCLAYADFRGDTPLHAAACNGYTDVARVLLENNVDPYVTNLAGLYPSTLALCNEHQETVEYFQSKGIEFQDLDDTAQDDAPGHVWFEFVDPESQAKYYAHSHTGVTQWEHPTDGAEIVVVTPAETNQ